MGVFIATSVKAVCGCLYTKMQLFNPHNAFERLGYMAQVLQV
jgi:hypothetical protein